jgi:tetratricopeptide (TPR) repeat protein
MDEVSALGVTFAARRRRGELAAAAGDWPRAVEQLRIAAALRPGDGEARRQLGAALLRAGAVDEGIAALREAARSPGQAAACWTLIAGAHGARGAFDLAREAVAEALRADPAHVEAHLMDARLAEREGKPGEALAAIDRAIAADPRSTAALEARARHLLTSGRDPERALKAHEAAERAIELQAGLAGGYECSALASMQLAALAPEPAARQEHVARALERFAQLVKYFPEHRDGHLHWIRALHATGRQRESEEAMRKARRLFPGDAAFLKG